MSRNRSDIFDEYVKIAKEKGLVSSDSKKKLESTHRADSLSITDIEALYGVKPNLPKNMEYEYNIMENAHLNSIVLSPSYDKLNGLVENNNERQNIILNIINKTPNGQLTQKKYAEQAFIASLVCTANDLDNRNKDELRILADACLMQVYSRNKLKKEAAAPMVMVIGIGLGVAALFGALYAHQHLPNMSEGLKQDYDILNSKLDALLGSDIFWGIAGHEFDDKLKQDVSGFKERLEHLMAAYDEVDSIIRDIEVPEDFTKLKRTINEPQTAKVIAAYNKLSNIIIEISSYINKMEKNFASVAYKKRHTKDKGFVTSLSEKTHILGGSTSLIGDDFQNVINAIGPFKEDVSEVVKLIKEAKDWEKKVAADIAAAKQTQSQMGVTTPATTPSAAPEPTEVAAIKAKEESEFGALSGL